MAANIHKAPVHGLVRAANGQIHNRQIGKANVPDGLKAFY